MPEGGASMAWLSSGVIRTYMAEGVCVEYCARSKVITLLEAWAATRFRLYLLQPTYNPFTMSCGSLNPQKANSAKWRLQVAWVQAGRVLL